MILRGPPGTGKATLAEMIARHTNTDVERIPAVTSGVKEIREAIERTRQDRNAGRRTILFVDEVYCFDRSQQNVFPPHIEDGTITSISATTGNPSFKLNSALFSRTRVYPLKSLSTENIEQVLTQAMEDKTRGHGGQGIALPDEARRAIAEPVNGSARRVLNTLEMMADTTKVDNSGKRILRPELLTETADEHSARFDGKGDRLYDLISALRKSIRGSALDATLYRYVRIITAGGDPLYVVRCCLAIASGDAGNIDSQAMWVVIAAWDCFTHVGPAEGERAIAQAVAYLACMSKSSTVYTVFKAALADVHERLDYDVPVHLCNAPTELMKEMGCGQECRYTHNEAGAYAIDEVHLPPEMTQTHYYFPTNRSFEGEIGERLAWLAEQDQNSPIEHYHQCCRRGNAINVSLWSQVMTTSPI